MDNAGNLYLNDKCVGTVYRSGRSTCWHYGLFEPSETFSEFSPLFTCWSSLMRGGTQRAELDEQTLAELRVAECAIDAIRAKIFWPGQQTWTRIGQLNIDGGLIEWKDSGDVEPPRGSMRYRG